MIDIKTILVPVDFSEPSKTAVNYGLSLALQFNGNLVLTHIVPSSTALVYTFPTESLAFEREQVKHARSTLPSLIPGEYRDRVNLRTIVKVGEVRSELLGVLHDEKIDLLVMGTHGRNVFERFFLGSLTERMLRKVPVPILTVSHLDPTKELHAVGPVPLRHVLYATDLSDSAEIGLKLSAELARGAGARLSVVHVFKSVDTIYWGAEGGYLGDELESLKEDAQKRLQLSIPETIYKDVKVTPVMLEGDAYREILEFADEQNVDMIVMNLQGKTAIERALLGSTAERVIRSAHVPVLSIPTFTEHAAGNVAA
jgi:nucleotide-binding universal stress UspA family protein